MTHRPTDGPIGSHLLLMSILLVGLFAASAFGQTSFTVTDLGTLGGTSSIAYGINDSGDIVGFSFVAGNNLPNHAFLWRQGTMTDLGTLEGLTDSLAFAINNHGQVVGYSFNPGVGDTIPFIWQNGVMTALPLLPGDRSGTAFAINDLGDVVGSSGDRAVIWTNGVVTALPVGTATQSEARGINDLGEIVGLARGPDLGIFPKAVIWRNGVMQALPTAVLPDCTGSSCSLSLTSVASAINESGGISGTATGADEINYAVRWVNGVATLLPLPQGASGSDTLFNAINDAGDVTGNSSIVNGTAQASAATFWPSDGPPQLLPNPPSTEPISLAIGINNQRQIVGVSGPHAVLWSPVTEDTKPPRVRVNVKGPDKIRASDETFVRVTFKGRATDAGVGLGTVTFAVRDEYGRVQPSGDVVLQDDGDFVIRVKLQATVRRHDRDGRRYTMRVTATDKNGNSATAKAIVTIVRHDRHDENDDRDHDHDDDHDRDHDRK